MQARFQDNFELFNRRMQQKVDKLGLAGPVVVKQEAGQLCRTLVELTGPKNRSKARQRIASKVGGFFQVLNSENPHDYQDAKLKDIRTKEGYGDIWWYSFTHSAVYGVSKDKDMTRSTPEELYSFYFGTKVNRLGRIVGKTRGKQTYYIWQKVMTTKARVQKLIKRLQDHLGRQKAAWAITWRDDLGAPNGTLGPVPEWVMRHAIRGKARGTSINGLGIKGHPTFTMINYALGISKSRGILAIAFKIRAKAMGDYMRRVVRGEARI